VLTHAFELREDGSIGANGANDTDEAEAQAATEAASAVPPSPPQLAYRDDHRGLWLYHGNCFELLDAIAAKYPDGRFDMIFAAPPYFLSNGGITCHAGKMVKVDKGDWDKSRGPELNHEFNLEWLRRCQRVLKPNGSIWVTGTLHVIFSVGYAMQQLGMKMLNDIAWEKPNPPPNLSCRYFTHSTETVLWAAKTEKSKHTFNYDRMREINGGKQMKTVWTMTSPAGAEKALGKHPTQKPLALVERCLLASTNESDKTIRKFGGQPIAKFATIRNDAEALKALPLKKMRQTDVMWIAEDSEGLYPNYAFEVENSTGVKNGLLRLLRIPDRFGARLYIVAPGDEEAKLFNRYIAETPFRDHAQRFQFHFYNEVKNFYESGTLFDTHRKSWSVQFAGRP